MLSGAGVRLTAALAGAFFAGADFLPDARFRRSLMLAGFVGLVVSGAAAGSGAGCVAGCDSGRASWD